VRLQDLKDDPVLTFTESPAAAVARRVADLFGLPEGRAPWDFEDNHGFETINRPRLYRYLFGEDG